MKKGLTIAEYARIKNGAIQDHDWELALEARGLEKKVAERLANKRLVILRKSAIYKIIKRAFK